MKTLNIVCGLFIGVATWLCLAVFFGGCGPDPESFHAHQCERTPGDLYSYTCATKGYERCWNPDGTVKYANCEYMGIICVASCSEVD